MLLYAALPFGRYAGFLFSKMGCLMAAVLMGAATGEFEPRKIWVEGESRASAVSIDDATETLGDAMVLLWNLFTGVSSCVLSGELL